MKLENQVCSLELAKKLKELGIEQNSIFEWLYRPDLYEWEAHLRFKNALGLSAFTAAELFELIPCTIRKSADSVEPQLVYCQIKKSNTHILQYINNSLNLILHQMLYTGTEADARAKMLIYLIENKVINHE